MLPECGDGIVTNTRDYAEECDPQANASQFECVGIGGDEGFFVCHPGSCTWATATNDCCVSIESECVVDAMCCSGTCDDGACAVTR
jgi:hypothetical protein